MLATVLEQYPDELRADFQQFYSLNLEGMGRTYTTFHAASLLTQLPEGSRVARALDPDAAWTMDRQLLAVIANDLNWLVWSQTKDGQKGRRKPKPIGPKGEQKAKDKGRKLKGMSMTSDELLAELARIHGESDQESVKDGQHR